MSKCYTICIRNLSIYRFWNPREAWIQSPADTEGRLQSVQSTQIKEEEEPGWRRRLGGACLHHVTQSSSVWPVLSSLRPTNPAHHVLSVSFLNKQHVINTNLDKPASRPSLHLYVIWRVKTPSFPGVRKDLAPTGSFVFIVSRWK